MEYYSGLIKELGDDDVFVFGANLQGIHGAGSAKFAEDKGWVLRVPGEGLFYGPNGKSYRFVTVGNVYPKRVGRTLEQICYSVNMLYKCANTYKRFRFLVAYTNTPNLLCGYAIEQLVECFKSHDIPPNVIFSDTLRHLFEPQS